jgi:hypothetical protein
VNVVGPAADVSTGVVDTGDAWVGAAVVVAGLSELQAARQIANARSAGRMGEVCPAGGRLDITEHMFGNVAVRGDGLAC